MAWRWPITDRAVSYTHLDVYKRQAHAGEAAGPESIRQALMVCGAERLGHGVRFVADIADMSWSDG